jgi:hypothetical protein
MDLTTVVVLVLTAIAVVFLVFFERNSRRNEAKLKAEAAAKANGTPKSSHTPDEQAKRNVIKKAS